MKQKRLQNKLDSTPQTLTPNKRRNDDKILPNNKANQNKGISYFSKYLDKLPDMFIKKENFLL